VRGYNDAGCSRDERSYRFFASTLYDYKFYMYIIVEKGLVLITGVRLYRNRFNVAKDAVMNDGGICFDGLQVGLAWRTTCQQGASDLLVESRDDAQ
jgi:hypothetical protein